MSRGIDKDSMGVYLFCLTPASSLPEITGNGIDPMHPLFVEVIGEVTAVLTEVNIDDFSGPAAKENMVNLEWVAPRALRHEEVVIAAMEQGPVLPVRFGTVFSSLVAVTEALRLRQDVFEKFFQNTAGMNEWILKGYANLPQNRVRMTLERMAAEKEQLAELSPGKRYFLEQKIKGEVAKASTLWLKRIGKEIGELAEQNSAEFSKCRLQSREVTGRDEEMFFHAALLVPDCSVVAMEGVMDAWNTQQKSQSLQLELSGPWPPYHFAPTL
jgi:hypothetical protein